MAIFRRMIRTYLFKDKDPVVDQLRTALQDAGLFSKPMLKKLAIIANQSYTTYEALFFGETRRPQNATVEGLLGAAGLRRTIEQVKKWTPEKLDAEVAKARAWNRKEAARIARLNAQPGHGKKRKPRGGKRPNLRVVRGGKAA